MAEHGEVRSESSASIPLLTVLQTFSGAIGEEQAWAVCYQCATAAKSVWEQKPDRCLLVTSLSQICLKHDGTVDPITWDAEMDLLRQGESAMKVLDRDIAASEQKIVYELGVAIFRALDFGMSEYEERHLSRSLESLIESMTATPSTTVNRHRHDADDEGIERDSESSDDDPPAVLFSLRNVIDRCVHHVQYPVSTVDQHFRAVCRALVAECLELTTFLRVVKNEARFMRKLSEDATCGGPASSGPLDELNCQQWGRLWVQIIGELRRGVKLKKVQYSGTPVEFELTPYEMLMDDIRYRRWKLKKVLIDSDIPCRVKKDAHAIILEFIRNRPPLKKASERKLSDVPMRPRKVTSHESLMESIRKHTIKLKKTPHFYAESGGSLRDLRTASSAASLDSTTPRTSITSNATRTTLSTTAATPALHRPPSSSGRRLIRLDPALLLEDDDDYGDDDDSMSSSRPSPHRSSHDRHHRRWSQFANSSDLALDLATQSVSFASDRRHSMASTVCASQQDVSSSSSSSSSGADPPPRPHQPGSHTASELQRQFLASSQWSDMQCLTLTLEEVVHIRSVLTKAELDSLPVECRIKEDVQRGKLCFLCMRTRFTFFGQRGATCRLCQRVICTKCCSKMRIPTDHFATIPVYSLTPSSLSPQEEIEPMSLFTKLQHQLPDRRRSVSPAGSTRSGPEGDTGAGSKTPQHRSIPQPQPHSLPFLTFSRVEAKLRGRTRLGRSHTVSRPGDALTSDRPCRSPSEVSNPSPDVGDLSGDPTDADARLIVVVCKDCKAMVLHISMTWRKRNGKRSQPHTQLTAHTAETTVQ